MKLYVTQDGGDFYVFSHPDCKVEHLMKERCCTAPFKVGDYDIHAARRAREWFKEYGYFKGAEEVFWPNPFAPVKEEPM